MNALIIPLVFAILGVFLYRSSPPTNPKAQELGRLMFAAAFSALMFAIAFVGSRLF